MSRCKEERTPKLVTEKRYCFFSGRCVETHVPIEPKPTIFEKARAWCSWFWREWGGLVIVLSIYTPIGFALAVLAAWVAERAG